MTFSTAWREEWDSVIVSDNAAQMRSTVDSLVASEVGLVSAAVVTRDEETRKAAEFLGLRVIAGGPNYAAGLNAGISSIKSRHCILISAGATIVTPFGFSEMARVSDDMGDSGLLLPMLTGDVRGRDFYRPGAPWETANIRPRDFMLVAGLLPMAVFRSVGPFDESFAGKTYADLDYAIRAIAAGLKIKLYQRVIVNNPRVIIPPVAELKAEVEDRAHFIEKHRAEMLRYGIR